MKSFTESIQFAFSVYSVSETKVTLTSVELSETCALDVYFLVLFEVNYLSYLGEEGLVDLFRFI